VNGVVYQIIGEPLMTAGPSAKRMKMAPSVETALILLSIFAPKAWPVAQTRNEDLPRRVCGF
jgi:hypothetical protein